MIGLGDRVEAWARRFGVPMPPGVRDDGEEPREDTGEDVPAARERRPAPPDERERD